MKYLTYFAMLLSSGSSGIFFGLYVREYSQWHYKKALPWVIYSLVFSIFMLFFTAAYGRFK